MMDTVIGGEAAESEDLGAKAVGPLLLHAAGACVQPQSADQAST